MLRNLNFIPDLPQSITTLDVRLNLMEEFDLDLNGLTELQEFYVSQNLWKCSCAFKSLLE